VLDAAIVGAAQSVEHYEIARYGTLIAWAESLGRDDIIRLQRLLDTTSALFSLCNDSTLYTPLSNEVYKRTRSPAAAGSFWEGNLDQSRI
jgi:Domain of unknown function (DUF892)